MRQILNMHPMRSLPNNQLPSDTAAESLLNEDTKNEKYKWNVTPLIHDYGGRVGIYSFLYSHPDS